MLLKIHFTWHRLTQTPIWTILQFHWYRFYVPWRKVAAFWKGRARKKTAFVCIHWRTQKNKNNGKTKLFVVAKVDRLCPVGAAWRIQAWFERLRYALPVVGISSEGCITAFAITWVLRESAARILKVDISDAVLKQYTPHSLHIVACVLFYEQGKSAVFMKKRLGWKSDTFMDYLQDTTILARQHSAAIVRAWLPRRIFDNILVFWY